MGAQPAPAVPSCPGWRVTDLVLHLGTVHRSVARVISGRLQEPPSTGDLTWLEVPGECAGWLPPAGVPAAAALPPALVGWFAAGAATLRALFLAVGQDEAVWTWWSDHSAGFWQRMQAIEAAVHRWDAQAATGVAGPVDAALAADAVSQTFEVMVPGRRARTQAPAGQGERFGFRRTDGTEYWALRFDPAGPVQHDGPCDVELSGTASDLMLFLWHRVSVDARAGAGADAGAGAAAGAGAGAGAAAGAGAGRFTVRGDASLLDRYFALVPPV